MVAEELPQSMRRAQDASNGELILRLMTADELAPGVTEATADPYQATILSRARAAQAELDRRGARR